VAPENSEISILHEMAVDGVAIPVLDRGPSIAEPDRARIIDRFYRPDTGGEGSGLGLAIVDTAIKRLGGQLQSRRR